MAKNNYYDQYGNQIRSRPRKRFYQKSSVWLIVVFLAIATFIAFNTIFEKENTAKKTTISKNEDVDEDENETFDEVSKTIEKAVEQSTYTYEDFKGTYVGFEGTPYKSPIFTVITIDDDQIVTGPILSTGSSIHDEIVEQTIEGNVLTLDWNSVYDVGKKGTTQYEIQYRNDQKSIRDINTGDTFYSVSNQDLQNYYSQSEIDYVRILMMNEVYVSDSDLSTLHVNDSLDYNHSTFPTALSNFDFIKNLNLTLLRFDYGDFTNRTSINIYYTPHGDGHITTYQLDDVELSLDRNVEEMEQEVLDTAETVYVEPSEPYLVADFIGRVEFIYE